MPQKYYLPPDDEGKASLFEHVRDHIAGYTATLGLAAGAVTAQAADATYFRWLVGQTITARGYSQAITAWRNAIRDGDAPATPQIPTPPASTPPPAVPPGIVPRFIALVKAIKAHSGYTIAIGEALKIVGDEVSAADTTNAQPDITGARVVADAVQIPWTKNEFDGVRIEVDRGTGFTFLAIDTRPDYTDTEPFPAAGAVWKYRAIYLLDDQKVGQWSPTVSVRVG